MIAATLGACLASSSLSLGTAALAARALPRALHTHLVALAAGVMLSAALLHLLPEALGTGQDAHALLATALAGLLLLHGLRSPRPQVCTVEAPLRDTRGGLLLGDALHHAVDGTLIAAAFAVQPWLGLSTALAVALHELPRQLGDLVLLRASGWSLRRALAASAATALFTLAGGLLGALGLTQLPALRPYALALAAGSLLYIATARLLPWLHGQEQRLAPLQQLLALAAGVLLLPLAGHGMHIAH